ncbi:MAG: D-alanyl-D-alanine carboxypeptidase/D-alanyl-D-alanine-endopeptidase [Gemmatimonadota bacterium]
MRNSLLALASKVALPGLFLLAGAGPGSVRDAAAQVPTPRDTRERQNPARGLDRQELGRRLERLIEDPALARAHVGLAVQVAETGEVLFTHAAERRFTAASTAKLVTAAAALRRLGPEYRWRTRLEAIGEIRDDTLFGDLWVVGGGDPRLTTGELAGWPALLREAGILHVRGDLVGDDRAFSGPRWGRGWMWEDVYAGWGAGVSALQLSPGRVRGRLLPGPEVGSPARLRFLDPASPPPVVNRVRTGAPASELRLEFEPSLEDRTVYLTGWIPAGRDSVRLSLAPAHPTRHLLGRVRDALADGGVEIGGEARRARAEERPAGVTWSRELPSETLAEIVGEFLKESDNQMGETLLRTLGLELGGAGSAEEGLRVLEETLAGWAIEPGAVSLADGSGLSRYTVATPAALVRLLRRAWQLPGFEALRAALPVAARDGTLARRLEATAAEGNARAKTGSLSGVRALAGYVRDSDGETLIFALLVNGYDAPGEVAAALEDLLVEQLSLYHGPDYARRREAGPERRP